MEGIDLTRAGAFLEHFGVRGMKWGVIRKRIGGKPVGDTEMDLVDNQTGKVRGTVTYDSKKVKRVGPDSFIGDKKEVARIQKQVDSIPHPDAVRTKESQRRAKATVDSLSTKELQELVTRMNLEQQYAKLASPQNKKNQLSIKEGMKTVNQILEAKKTVNKLMEDPFISEAVNNIKEDFGINGLIRKAAGGAAGKVFK